ncbi:MAG: acetate--CoA ligase family protein [Candidatus Moranbacteria bacterium]|jgi:acetyl coenzyme A synthetase (ADP forming)-like protein|nr:acetate--CoA ligase family protein [Candidatus Moranbacteria bacterium]MBP9801812.1 acetate--CoA ligase family protein [Candidatus Moranbacteria bacterium]
MQLSTLLHPQSIAIIGASTQEGSVGWSLARNIIEQFPGQSYPINPKTVELFGKPCFPSVLAVEDSIDLAVIAVPAALVSMVLKECGEKNIPAVVIISAGFKEIGDSGKILEDEIVRIAKEYSITLLGPNCLGFLAPHEHLNASFAKTLPLAGSISFFSQSGALLTALLDMSGENLGYRTCISTGNKAQIKENDFIKFFALDEGTSVISFYSEDLSDAKNIIETGRALLKRAVPKPVIALKSGKTAAGTAASSSHTGALAGSDAAYEALFKQAGIIRVEGLETLTETLEVFSKNPLPAGKRVALLTNAGGLGVMATDACIENGLELAGFMTETIETLQSFLPAAANSHNPVDVLGDAQADRYERALTTLLSDQHVDMLIIIITPQAMTEALKTAEAIASARDRFPDKPIVVSLSGGKALAEAQDFLVQHKVAVLRSPESVAQTLGHLSSLARLRERSETTTFDFTDIRIEEARAVLNRSREQGRLQLSEESCIEFLSAYGFQFLANKAVTSREEALLTARSFNKIVALKIISPEITHKSDSGGVLLDIDPNQADFAYDTLMATVAERVPNAKLEGALVVEMAHPGGREFILGLKKEPGLGTLVMVGLGGIFVEVFKDVSFRFAEALTHEDARAMLRELKSYPLIEGVRGQAGLHEETLIDALGRLARIVTDFPEIAELDINPLLAFQHGADFRTLDARIRIE